MSREQCPEKLVQWLGDVASKERRFLTFLGLNKRLITFPRWFVHEDHALSEQVLAAMCHTVAHGAL